MSIIKQDYGELSGGGTNIDITNPDYISSEVTIAANGSYTFTTERRIKQFLFMSVPPLSTGYPSILRLYNCEEEKAILIASSEYNLIRQESFDTACLGQTDTTITLKNVSSVSRKYKLLAWF